MGWWFRFVLVAHLFGVLLLVTAMALQAATAVLLRRATRPGDVWAAQESSRAVPRLFAIATVLILASGVYLTVIRVRFGEPWSWAAMSFVAVIVLAAWGKTWGKQHNGHLAHLASESGEAFTPALREALNDPAPFTHAALGAWVVAGIVILMVYRPTAWVSLTVLAAALLASLATRGWLYRRMPAPSIRNALEGKQHDPS